MSLTSRRYVLGAALAACAVAPACSKPEPPVLTPQEAQITRLDMAGADLRVKMEAYNPNRIPLSAQRVTGRIVLDGQHDLGTVTVDKPMSLPAGARTVLEVPLTVKWTGASSLATLAAARRAVPYTVDGTMTVGGEHLNVDVPFTMRGVITQEQLVNATVKSLQNLPGLVPPPK